MIVQNAHYAMPEFTYMYIESCMEVHVLMQTVLIFMLRCYGLTKSQQCDAESDWRSGTSR